MNIENQIAESISIEADRISVNTDSGNYEVFSGCSLIKDGSDLFKEIYKCSRVIVDKAVYDRHEILQDILPCEKTLVIRGGENCKTVKRLHEVWNWLAESGAKRDDYLIAIGGGALLDLAGFAASTWMRGMKHIMFPTTLLSMVDASVGGKTAVNLKAGKNLAGTFHQPRLVVADMDFLRTLPSTQFRSGLGEVIKTAMIGDESLVEDLLNLGKFRRKFSSNTHIFKEIATKCIHFKASIVAEDEFETGNRKALNYGHTLGHALEASFAFKGITHGEAVCMGMDFAAWLGMNISESTKTVQDIQRDICHSLKLPPQHMSFTLPDHQAVSVAMNRDKKSVQGGISFVFVPEPGRYSFRTLDITYLSDCVQEYFSLLSSLRN